MFTVLFTKSAEREYKNLDSKIQAKVQEAVKLLRISPYSDLLQIKKLKGDPHLYRVRIGDYRIVYEVAKVEIRVIIIKIGHRREVYR